jgi:DNA-binding MarR family transcriptional regulator/uncharacterized protein YbdZ (MbtH family)
MKRGVPLFALLSQALVAFTIEFDNEVERRLPHRTTDHGRSGDSRHAPWLVSLAMWETCMRYVGEDGITVRELGRLARTGTNLAGMQRWGYISLDPDPSKQRSKQPAASATIRATEAGRRAQAVWEPLLDEIEARWRERFGAEEIARLRAALAAVDGQRDPGLPDCMPILGYGMSSGGAVAVAVAGKSGSRHAANDFVGKSFPHGTIPAGGRAASESTARQDANDSVGKSFPHRTIPAGGRAASESTARQDANDFVGKSFPHRTIPAIDQLPLSRLLARVLLAFAIEFENDSEVSLAICADALRLLDDDGVRVSELPRRAGVSKEGMTMAVGFLTRHGYAESVADPSRGRGKVVRLNRKGRAAQTTYGRLIGTIEERWAARFGGDTVLSLRASIDPVLSDRPRLFSGLEPPPGGWRASIRRPEVLPDYPMVLHRGGFPDGS